MIILNDVDRTVIDESKAAAYYGYGEDKTCIVLSTCLYVDYYSQEQRDKDIELLDKIFGVKSIEYKAMSVEKPEYSNEGSINEESEPTKEEKYVTWKDVKRYATGVKVELPNGDIRTVYYKEEAIYFTSYFGDDWDCAVYDEYLFNSLKLKKVE